MAAMGVPSAKRHDSEWPWVGLRHFHHRSPTCPKPLTPQRTGLSHPRLERLAQGLQFLDTRLDYRHLVA